MKTPATSFLALACATAFAFTALADTWTDPTTGIRWNYLVGGTEASLGSGTSSGRAIAADTSGAIIIPLSLGGFQVTSIGQYSFCQRTQLTSVTIPLGVTRIGAYAFHNCSALTSMTIPSSVKSIGSSAFSACSALTSVLIPSSVTSIGDSAFSCCSTLKTVCVDKDDVSRVKTLLVNSGLDCSGVTFIETCKVTFDPGSNGSGARQIAIKTNGVDLVLSETIFTRLGYTQTGWATSDVGVMAYALGATYTNDVAITLYPVWTLDVYPDGGPYTNTVDGIDWVFSISGSKAMVGTGQTSAAGRAITRKISGALSIPSTLGGRYVTCIGDYAFYGCSALTSVKIPSSVTSIGNHAFYYCSGLTSVTIPSSVTSIGKDAFMGCIELKTIYVDSGDVARVKNLLPNSDFTTPNLTFIQTYRVTYEPGSNGMGAGQTVRMTKGVDLVLSDAIFTRTGYTQTGWATSDGGMQTYGLGASYTANATITLYPVWTEDAYPDGSYTNTVDGIAWTFTVSDEKATLGTGSSSGRAISNNTSGAITIPSVLGGCPVTSIGSSAFSYCSGLTNVTIPSSVTSIGNWAFDGCSALTSVTIPLGVTSIGEGAFSGCSTLTSVTIPSSVASIGDDAFRYCHRLTSIVVDAANPCYASVDGALYNKAITTLVAWPDGKASATLPPSVTSIGDWAFYCCSGLTSVSIPSSVTSIGDGAFQYCRGLTSVTIPTSVTNIGIQAFEHCSGLTSVTIPSSVANIGNWAFYGCSELTSVSIPSSVKGIGENAFWGCSGLKSVTIPSSVTNIGSGAFQLCTKLTSMTIPSSVKSIGDWAFCACSALTSVTISEGVTSIGERAFFFCTNLTSVTISEGVTSIGDDAFLQCRKLATVFVDADDATRVRTLLANSGFDCSKVTFKVLNPLPELVNPTSEEVKEAFETAADAKLAEMITNATDYAAFRDWAGKVKAAGGTDAAGLQAVQNAPHAWLSYALGSATLIEKTPTADDITVETFTPSSESGKFDFTVSVEGVTVGSDALKENLKQVFGLEGATSLDANAFSASNVDLTFGTPEDGKVKFTAGPNAANAASGTFFMKVKMTP